MNNLEKEFVPYEEAMELKELGFNEPCFGYYIKGSNKLNIAYIKNDRIYNENSNGSSLIGYGKSLILSFTYSQAFRWFREKYDLHRHIYFLYENNEKWGGDIYKISNGELMNNPMEISNLKTYEEAKLACLKKLIEIAKTNKP